MSANQFTADQFTYVATPHSEKIRRREILGAHPDVRRLMGNNPWSGVIIAAIVSAQVGIALAIGAYDVHWAIVIVSAYLVGSFLNHALYVLVHEATHNLIIGGDTANRLFGILCDVALFLPGALAFRKYHLLHHQYGGVPELDPDVCAEWEARLVRNVAWRKALWLSCFMIIQACRPLKSRAVPIWDRWIVANIVVIIATGGAIVYFGGIAAGAYLFLSTLFGLGLHPLGGRWIQEHYTAKEGQETYSYYGCLNRIAFNIGYHNEHHDLMNVPWNRLPMLKAMAPEFYEPLKSYRSLTRVLIDFIVNPQLSPRSRIVRRLEHAKG